MPCNPRQISDTQATLYQLQDIPTIMGKGSLTRRIQPSMVLRTLQVCSRPEEGLVIETKF